MNTGQLIEYFHTIKISAFLPLASRFFLALSGDFAYSKKKRPKDINIRSDSRNDPVTLSWWLGSLRASTGFWMFPFHWNFSFAVIVLLLYSLNIIFFMVSYSFPISLRISIIISPKFSFFKYSASSFCPVCHIRLTQLTHVSYLSIHVQFPE